MRFVSVVREGLCKEMVFKMRWSQPCHAWWERTWGKGEKQSRQVLKWEIMIHVLGATRAMWLRDVKAKALRDEIEEGKGRSCRAC